VRVKKAGTKKRCRLGDHTIRRCQEKTEQTINGMTHAAFNKRGIRQPIKLKNLAKR
jgi:hypothetical protein